jgi:hypothetical protein
MTLTPPEAHAHAADAESRARRYVDHVRAALPDVPAVDRDALLDGLAEHLLEPGEDHELLLDEVPSPQAYAAELRASLPPAPAPYPRAQAAAPGPAPARRFPVVAVVLAVVGTFVLLSVLALVTGLVLWSAGPEPATATVQAPVSDVRLGSDAFTLPDVVGLDDAAAVDRLQRLGLTVAVIESPTVVATVPSGVVIQMEPAAPSLATVDTEVVLVVAP